MCVFSKQSPSQSACIVSLCQPMSVLYNLQLTAPLRAAVVFFSLENVACALKIARKIRETQTLNRPDPWSLLQRWHSVQLQGRPPSTAGLDSLQQREGLTRVLELRLSRSPFNKHQVKPTLTLLPQPVVFCAAVTRSLPLTFPSFVLSASRRDSLSCFRNFSPFEF